MQTEAFSQNDRFLNLFWELATADPEVHKPAAVTLIRSVNECQKKYEREQASVAATERCCPELSYSLKRCIGGLGNTNRPGFFMALAQALITFPAISLSQVGSDILAHFNLKDAHSGSEAQQFRLGRLFGFLALAQSDRLRTLLQNAKEGAAMMNVLVTFITSVVEDGLKMPELSIEVINTLIAVIPKKSFEQSLKEKLIALTNVDKMRYTPELLSLLLSLLRTYSINLPDFCQFLHPQSIVDEINLKEIAPILEICQAPYIPLVWDSLFQIAEDSTNPDAIVSIWNILIDPLFASLYYDKVYLAFMLLKQVLPRVQNEQLQLLFTDRFVQAVTVNLKKGTNASPLLGTVKHIVFILIKRCQLEPAAGHTLLLLLKRKDPNLSQLNSEVARALTHAFKAVQAQKSGANSVTHSIVQGIIQKFQAAGVAKSESNGEDTKSSKMETERRTLIAQLFGLYVSPQASAADSSLILQFFYYYSHHNPHAWKPETTTPSKSPKHNKGGKQKEQPPVPTAETKFYMRPLNVPLEPSTQDVITGKYRELMYMHPQPKARVKQYESWESVYALTQSLKSQSASASTPSGKSGKSSKASSPKGKTNTNEASSTATPVAKRDREDVLASLEKLIGSLATMGESKPVLESVRRLATFLYLLAGFEKKDVINKIVEDYSAVVESALKDDKHMVGLVEFAFNVYNNPGLLFYFTLVNLVHDLFGHLSIKINEKEVDTFFEILREENENAMIEEEEQEAENEAMRAVSAGNALGLKEFEDSDENDEIDDSESHDDEDIDSDEISDSDEEGAAAEQESGEESNSIDDEESDDSDDDESEDEDSDSEEDSESDDSENETDSESIGMQVEPKHKPSSSSEESETSGLADGDDMDFDDEQMFALDQALVEIVRKEQDRVQARKDKLKAEREEKRIRVETLTHLINGMGEVITKRRNPQLFRLVLSLFSIAFDPSHLCQGPCEAILTKLYASSDYPVLSESDRAYCRTVISGLLKETESKLSQQEKKSLHAYNAHHARQVTAALLIRYITCALTSSPLKKYLIHQFNTIPVETLKADCGELHEHIESVRKLLRGQKWLNSHKQRLETGRLPSKPNFNRKQAKKGKQPAPKPAAKNKKGGKGEKQGKKKGGKADQ